MGERDGVETMAEQGMQEVAAVRLCIEEILHGSRGVVRRLTECACARRLTECMRGMHPMARRARVMSWTHMHNKLSTR